MRRTVLTATDMVIGLLILGGGIVCFVYVGLPTYIPMLFVIVAIGIGGQWMMRGRSIRISNRVAFFIGVAFGATIFGTERLIESGEAILLWLGMK